MYSNNLRLNLDLEPNPEDFPKNGIKKEESLRLVKNSSKDKLNGNRLCGRRNKENIIHWADVQLSLLNQKAKGYMAKIGNNKSQKIYDVSYLSENDPVRLHLQDKNVGLEIELEEIVNQINISTEQGDQKEYIFAQEMLRKFENRIIIRKHDKIYKYILKCAKLARKARAKLTQLVHELFENNVLIRGIDEDGNNVTVAVPKCTI